MDHAQRAVGHVCRRSRMGRSRTGHQGPRRPRLRGRA